MDERNVTIPSFIPYFYSDNYFKSNNSAISYNNTESFNFSSEPADKNHYIELILHLLVILKILRVLIFILGLAGNTLVIYVLSRFSETSDIAARVTNIYNRNLAIADLSVIICLFVVILRDDINFNLLFGEIMCHAFWLAYYATEFTSTIFLAVIAADRYFLICHPISSRKYRTPQVARLVSIGAWCFSALITSPIMLYANYETFLNEYICSLVIGDDDGHFKFVCFQLFLVVMEFVIPLCFIVTSYYFMIKRLRSVTKQANRPKGKRRSHRKATKVVMSAIVVYVFCLLPHWIAISLLLTSSNDIILLNLLFTIALLLSYSNSAINPILYVFLSNDFKKTLAKACPCVARFIRIDQQSVEMGELR